jgi:hypothetical protein
VRQIEIDIVGFETPQTLFDFVSDRFRAEVTVNTRAILIGEESPLSGVPNQAALRGENNLIAASANSLAHDAFGKTEPIGRSRIDEVDTGVE